MRLLYEAGGVKTTVVDDRMQRAPVFVLRRRPRGTRVRRWLDEHFDDIKAAAEATTAAGAAARIEQYSASRDLYTRFDFTTGDAAGQNMTGKATSARATGSSPTTRSRASTSSSQLRHRQEELAGQHPAHPGQARGRRGDDPRRAARRNMRATSRGCSEPARSPTSAASCPASTITAPIRPTPSPRCSSPPGRTSPTSRSPRRA